jgi:hypothetical protein
MFQTLSPITKGTRFKMSIKNATECYIYISDRRQMAAVMFYSLTSNQVKLFQSIPLIAALPVIVYFLRPVHGS